MLIIDEDVISLTRGDTGYIEVYTDAEWEEGDTTTFSVKKTYEDEEYVFQRIVPAGQVIIIYPEDTAELEYGNYLYDIQINTVLGEVFTVKGPAKFKVTKEVTV